MLGTAVWNDVIDIQQLRFKPNPSPSPSPLHPTDELNLLRVPRTKRSWRLSSASWRLLAKVIFWFWFGFSFHCVGYDSNFRSGSDVFLLRGRGRGRGEGVGLKVFIVFLVLFFLGCRPMRTSPSALKRWNNKFGLCCFCVVSAFCLALGSWHSKRSRRPWRLGRRFCVSVCVCFGFSNEALHIRLGHFGFDSAALRSLALCDCRGFGVLA